MARLPVYVERLRDGTVNTRPRPSVARRDGAIAIVDGDRGPGQVASVFATDLSVELAREHGVGVVGVRHSAHNGAQAFYAMRAAEQGMVALAMTNTEPLVIPYGGAEPALGTNPICLAAPAADGIFNLDLATSQVAINRIFNARDEGRAIPEGWGVDADGRSTTDAAAVVSAVPLGGYKGYALALMVELLCGVLPGAGVRHGVGGLYTGAQVEQDVGHFHLALDPERTVGRDRFAAVLGGLRRRAARDPAQPRLRRGARARRSRGPGARGARARGRADRAGAVGHAARPQRRARRGGPGSRIARNRRGPRGVLRDMVKRTLTVGLAAVALGLAACGGSDSEPAEPAAAKASGGPAVQVGDNTFTPATIEVKTGDTVTFENGGAIAHTVTGDGFDSGSMAPGDTFTFTADKAGSVSYVCTFHPGMQGTIEVS